MCQNRFRTMFHKGADPSNEFLKTATDLDGFQEPDLIAQAVHFDRASFFPIYIPAASVSNGCMRIFWRFVGWAMFVGLLAAVGTVIFFWVRYQPRVVIGGRYHVLHLADDGSRLVTASFGNRQVHGPIRVWDLRTGEPIHRFVDNTMP